MLGSSYISDFPVALSENVNLESGPIIENVPTCTKPKTLPVNFTWSTLDITNDNQINELYKLLRDNYVEDIYSELRFDYSTDFLRWCLTPPGYVPDLNVAIWHNTPFEKILVGYINAVPATIRVDKNVVPMVIADFLCIHKDYRNKRLTPIIMQELIRRTNLHGIKQAVATCGKQFQAAPIGSFKFYHRPINIKRLLDANYWYLEDSQTLKELKKQMAIKKKSTIKGLRGMRKSDCQAALNLLNVELKKKRLSPVFTVETFSHQFLIRNKVICSFVVEGDNGEITDFISVYNIPTTVISQDLTLNIAYIYYCASDRTTELVGDILPLIRDMGIDCLNVLNFGQFNDTINQSQFKMGTGTLRYYLYNWHFGKACTNDDVTLTLL